MAMAEYPVGEDRITGLAMTLPVLRWSVGGGWRLRGLELAQAQACRVVRRDGQLVLGLHVVAREDVQPGFEGQRGGGLPREVQAQRGDLAGAEVVVAARAAKRVARDLLGLQGEHGQVVEARAL